MLEGWVKLDRSLLDSRVFSDADLWRIYTWCLIKANQKTAYFQGVEIPSGSFATGRKAAGEELEISEFKFDRAIKRLQSWGLISLKPHNRFTIVGVVNCSVLEQETPVSDDSAHNQRTTGAQQAHTIGEDIGVESSVLPTVKQWRVQGGAGGEEIERSQKSANSPPPLKSSKTYTMLPGVRVPTTNGLLPVSDEFVRDIQTRHPSLDVLAAIREVLSDWNRAGKKVEVAKVPKAIKSRMTRFEKTGKHLAKKSIDVVPGMDEASATQAFDKFWLSYPEKMRRKRPVTAAAYAKAVWVLMGQSRDGQVIDSQEDAQEWLQMRVDAYARSRVVKLGKICWVDNWVEAGRYDDSTESWNASHEKGADVRVRDSSAHTQRITPMSPSSPMSAMANMRVIG